MWPDTSASARSQGRGCRAAEVSAGTRRRGARRGWQRRRRATPRRARSARGPCVCRRYGVRRRQPARIAVQPAVGPGIGRGGDGGMYGVPSADSGISKSEASRICADLGIAAGAFRHRSRVEQQFLCMFLDAACCKVRGQSPRGLPGRRERLRCRRRPLCVVLGFAVGDSEEGESELTFVEKGIGLAARVWPECQDGGGSARSTRRPRRGGADLAPAGVTRGDDLQSEGLLRRSMTAWRAVRHRGVGRPCRALGVTTSEVVGVLSSHLY